MGLIKQEKELFLEKLYLKEVLLHQNKLILIKL